MCQTHHLSLAILLRHSPLLTSKLRSTSRSSNLLMWSMRKLICSVKVPWTREKAETTKNGMLFRRKRNRGERIQLSLLQEHQKLVSIFPSYLGLSTLLNLCLYHSLLSDLRTFRTFYSLVQRLLEPDLASSPQVCLIFPPPNVRPKSDSLLSTPYFRLLALLRPLDRIDSLCQRG